MSEGPLVGVKVIEMGQLIAGPFCGQLLGDMGADVVKIEAPGRGDPMRQWGQKGYPLFWEILGRNKRTVSIDLRQPAGQDLAPWRVGTWRRTICARQTTGSSSCASPAMARQAPTPTAPASA